MTRPLAVFDVDGVLAAVRHRLHHVERRPKDWDAFFAAALDDPPLEQGVSLAQASAEECDVVYVTGRPERCRADTLTWFRRHGLPEGELRMRDDVPHGLGRLTRAEAEVVRLVADGGTNREVAGRLFLSPHTVNTHLRSAFGKLGVRSRVELTRLVAAQERS